MWAIFPSSRDRANILAMMCWVASVVVLKYAGLLVHPICRADGTTNHFPGCAWWCGISYTKFGSCPARIVMRQNPSERSIFDHSTSHWHGHSNWKRRATNIVVPSCFTASWLVAGSVVSLKTAGFAWRSGGFPVCALMGAEHRLIIQDEPAVAVLLWYDSEVGNL
jgi:hypothetical protein